MSHLISRAINPAIGLKNAVNNWPRISMLLRERRRKRRNQVAVFLNSSDPRQESLC